MPVVPSTRRAAVLGALLVVSLLAVLLPSPARAAGVTVRLLFGDDSRVASGFVVAAGPGGQAVVAEGGSSYTLDLGEGTWQLVGMADATGTRSSGTATVRVSDGRATPSVLTLYVEDPDGPAAGGPGDDFINCTPQQPAPGDEVSCVAGTFDPGSDVLVEISGLDPFTVVADSEGVVAFTYVQPGAGAGGGGGGGGGSIGVTGPLGGEENVVVRLDASGTCAGADDVSFTDVDPGGVFAADIGCVAGYGLVDGVGDGTFRPSEPVTRGEASKFVANLVAISSGAALSTPATNPFDDVVADGTFGPFVRQLAGAGIVDGVGPGVFAPGRSLTRGEMASIVHAALVELGVTLPTAAPDFPDVSGSGVFGGQIGALTRAGVLQGFADGTFRPGEPITRGQLARYVALSMALADLNDPDLFVANGVAEAATVGAARVDAAAFRTTQRSGTLDRPATAFRVHAFGLVADDATATARLDVTSGAAQAYLLLHDGTARRLVGSPATTTAELADVAGGDQVRVLVVADQADTSYGVTVGLRPAAQPFHVRVNTGGQEVPATDGGPDWERDSRGSPSQWLAQGSNTTYLDGPVLPPYVGVPAHVPQEVFATERWGSRTSPAGALEPLLRYEFPVQLGQAVTLRLFLGDGYDPTDGQGLRVFDVVVDGEVWLDDVDLSVTPGWGVGTMRELTLVSDGRVDLVFRNDVENPSVRGIEVVSTDY